MIIFYVWITLINIIGFMLFAIDKYLAKKQAQRISENTLLLVAFLGGAPGSIFAMRTFRHKTQKAKFTVGIPLLIVANGVVLYFTYTQFIQ